MQSLNEVSAYIRPTSQKSSRTCKPPVSANPGLIDDRLNNPAKVTSSLVDVALSDNPDRRTRLEEIYAAAEHGEHRLKMGFGEDLLSPNSCS